MWLRLLRQLVVESSRMFVDCPCITILRLLIVLSLLIVTGQMLIVTGLMLIVKGLRARARTRSGVSGIRSRS